MASECQIVLDMHLSGLRCRVHWSHLGQASQDIQSTHLVSVLHCLYCSNVDGEHDEEGA